jgi:GNAT superfamily N-acetyltransferase
MNAPLHIRRLTAEQADAYVDLLADVLIDCVQGNASVSFMLPIAREKAQAFWRGVAQGVERKDRILFVAEDGQGRIQGTVQLVFAGTENQPHRADVSKLLVPRAARRQGVAARLMVAVEDAARQAGLRTLVLDTTTGSDAERVYARAGWQKVGDVPDYALMPDGTPSGTTFYYKTL